MIKIIILLLSKLKNARVACNILYMTGLPHHDSCTQPTVEFIIYYIGRTGGFDVIFDRDEG